MQRLLSLHAQFVSFDTRKKPVSQITPSVKSGKRKALLKQVLLIIRAAPVSQFVCVETMHYVGRRKLPTRSSKKECACILMALCAAKHPFANALLIDVPSRRRWNTEKILIRIITVLAHRRFAVYLVNK